MSNTSDFGSERRLMNRRRFLGGAVAAGLLPWANRLHADEATPPQPVPQYRIAVCDWMILKRQKLSAFALAKEIGADGVEVDMGGLGTRETFDNKLADA